MWLIREGKLRVLVGQGYVRAVEKARLEQWFAKQVERIIDILDDEESEFREASIVFDPKLKKDVWVKDGVLKINLAKDESVLARRLRDKGVNVLSATELEEMKAQLQFQYREGDDLAGDQLVALSGVRPLFVSR